MAKHVFITGGVVSSLGKGITGASLGRLLKSRGLRVVMQKAADYAVAYGEALVKAGADMLSGGDSPAGLLGPRLYRDVAEIFFA